MEKQYIFFDTAKALALLIVGLIVWVPAIFAMAFWYGATSWTLAAIFLGSSVLVVLPFKVDKWCRRTSR